jgi:threonine dehydrogenase-like Zn-dependent dehydrogenase
MRIATTKVITRRNTMSKQRFEVQRHLDQVYVARQNGDVPQPQPGEVLLQMVACGICGADIRVVTKNKTASGEAGRYTTLGHEGIGRVVAVGGNVAELQLGDYTVVLPHVHRDECAPPCLASSITPVCIGCGHTLHMGWDIDGCFTDVLVVPITNIVRIDQRYLHLAARQAPRLREAIFALVEPMLCTLSAYELVETYLQRELPPGRALVIGCGPIGVLHSLALLERGFEVWLMDTLQKRAELAQWCLDYQGQVFDPAKQAEAFDLVMVTASSAAAVRTGETLVRKGGIVYLFAGLNTIDRAAMDREKLFLYESLHRRAQDIRTTVRLVREEKPVLYLGHSGYFERLAPRAIAAVAAHAAALDRAVTGVIPGFASPRIVSRLPGGIDWTTEDGSPAIVSILNGTDLRERHCKLLVLPDAEHYS